jgi:hypothetical protein
LYWVTLLASRALAAANMQPTSAGSGDAGLHCVWLLFGLLIDLLAEVTLGY